MDGSSGRRIADSALPVHGGFAVVERYRTASSEPFLVCHLSRVGLVYGSRFGADREVSLDDSGGGLRLVTDRVVPVFGRGVWLVVPGGWRCCPMCSGRHRLRPRRGGLLSGVVGAGWLVRR